MVERGTIMASSLVIWMVTLTAALCAIILSAAVGVPDVHALTACLISLFIAAIAISENRKQVAADTDPLLVAASTARHMGYVWSWGALGLFVTYFFIIQWKEWLTFTIGFFVIAVLCLFFARILERDAESANTDGTMLKLGRTLTMVQAGGMIIAMIGLLIDGKIPATHQKSPLWQDWAANNIFFFGALALAAISINSLITQRDKVAA